MCQSIELNGTERLTSDSDKLANPFLGPGPLDIKSLNANQYSSAGTTAVKI